jgi:tetratricopeptide (TPR) repeat protein
MYQVANIEAESYLSAIEALERVVRKQPSNPEPLNVLTWDLLATGYHQEALHLAERYVDIDPLSQLANYRLYETLYAVGRTSEAVAALKLADQLGADFAEWRIGEANLVEKRDETAIAHFESQLQQYDVESAWVRELVAGARDPASGQAYLDRRIPQIVASMPDEDARSWQLTLANWYLVFGFPDRQFELILATDLTPLTWSDAEVSIHYGSIYRRLGFTAHPKYLEVAEALDFIGLWEQRGPPDYCEKAGGQWVCE